MADLFRYSLPASFFIGDENAIIEAGDIPATPDNPSGRASMKFPDGSDEPAMVSQSFAIPASDVWTSGSGVKLKIYYFGDAAPGANNDVQFDAAFECVSEADALDLHGTADDFDTEQTVSEAMDANAGRLNVMEISFIQAEADGIEPEDSCRICVRRDSNAGAGVDDYADSIWVLHVDLYEVV